MSSRKQNKERERIYVELFKSVYKNFPDGTLLADEKQEQPDVLVLTDQGKIGIEVTEIVNPKQKRTESECQKVVLEACRIYENEALPKLWVGVHFGSEDSLNKRNRIVFANAIARLVVSNIPTENGHVELENDWNDSKQFPFEISAIVIYRHKSLERNHWSSPSAGVYRENFTDELQTIITEKDSKLPAYEIDCKEQWLLVVAENSSPSTFFDPSEKTVAHCYTSSFNKVFLLKSFRLELFELKLNSNA